MAPVILLCTRQTSLKLPADGKFIVYVCPLVEGAALTHAEPSKLLPVGVLPGHPTNVPVGEFSGGRTWPGFRKVTVWSSPVRNVQRMLSPVWIQNSFGKNARAWFPWSGLCAPAEAVHCAAETPLAPAPANRAAPANQAARLVIFLC